jgi:putative transposase
MHTKETLKITTPRHYREFIGGTMQNLVSNGHDMRDILATVVESLMEIERTTHLAYEYKNTPPDENKRNGYYTRFAETLNGSIELRVPRDRLGTFTPLMLEVVRRDTARMHDLALMLYGNGVSGRAVERIFKEIFNVSYSPQRVSDMVALFEKERIAWQAHPLTGNWIALMIDVIRINIRRDTVSKEAVYVIYGLKSDYTRDVLGLYVLPEESVDGWKEALLDVRTRGVARAPFLVSDEFTGLAEALEEVYPDAKVQSCLVHKKRNILKYVRSGDKKQIADELRDVIRVDDPNDTPEAFDERMRAFVERWAQRYPKLRGVLPEARFRFYRAYLTLPLGLRRYLYTTNWIERLNKEIRKITRHTNSFPNEDSALNLVFMVVQNMRHTYEREIPVSPFTKAQVEELYTGVWTQSC